MVRRLVEQDGILWMCCVPQGDEILTGLADIIPVEDRAREHAGLIELITEGHLRPVLDADRAVQGNRGRPGAQTVYFDGAAGSEISDEAELELRHGQTHNAFDETCSVRELANQLRLLYGVALLDARAVYIDGLYFVSHSCN